MHTLLQECVRNPELHFGAPAEILKSIDLTDEDKLTILSSWKNDLVELQHASEENMCGRDDESNRAADILRRVLAAIRILERKRSCA